MDRDYMDVLIAQNNLMKEKLTRIAFLCDPINCIQFPIVREILEICLEHGLEKNEYWLLNRKKILMTRELTKEETKRLLTKKEVENLCEGTEIMVKWAGGNGPYKYKLSGLKDAEDLPTVYIWEDNKTINICNLHIGNSLKDDRIFFPFCQECEMYFIVDEQNCLNDYEFCRCPRCNYRCTCGDYWLTKERL